MRSENKMNGDEKDEKAFEKKGHHVVSVESNVSPKAEAKDDDGCVVASDKNELVDNVLNYFFDDDEFAQTFETFAARHCHAFDLESDEMKLEYTDIYTDFLALFEGKLEGAVSSLTFIQAQGATVHEFYEILRQAYESDRESGTVLCSEILMATADFDVFVLMMRQTKETALLAKR